MTFEFFGIPKGTALYRASKRWWICGLIVGFALGYTFGVVIASL